MNETENKFKEDAIKYAWTVLVGEENFSKLKLDENGYSNWQCRKLMPSSYWGQLSDKLKPGVSGMATGADILYRPKTLRGLETNNGWHRIFNSDSMPKAANDYVFLVDGREVTEWYDVGKRFARNYTHWRNVIETPKPLF